MIKSQVKVGDKIRILKDRLCGAKVRRGKILLVVYVDNIEFHTPGNGPGGMWYFPLYREGEGFEIVSEETSEQSPPMPETLTVSGITYVRLDRVQKTLEDHFNA